MRTSEKLRVTVWWKNGALGGALWKHELRFMPTLRMRLLHRLSARLRPNLIGSRTRHMLHDWAMATYCDALRAVLLKTPTAVEEETRDKNGALAWTALETYSAYDVASHLEHRRLVSISGTYAGGEDTSFVCWSCPHPRAA